MSVLTFARLQSEDMQQEAIEVGKADEVKPATMGPDRH